MITGTAALAIYGSVVATAGLGWQVVVAVLHRRTHVLIRFREGVLGPRVEIVNQSEHAVRVVEAGIRSKEGEVAFGGRWSALGKQLLDDVPPRDARFAQLKDEDLLLGVMADVLAEPSTAWVRLSTGEEFTSPKMPLFR